MEKWPTLHRTHLTGRLTFAFCNHLPGSLRVTSSLVFSCVKSQVHLPAQKPTGCAGPWPHSPGVFPFSAIWGHQMQGEDGAWETGVSSPLPHPLTLALSPMVSLPSCLVSTQKQGYAQLCVITFTPLSQWGYV